MTGTIDGEGVLWAPFTCSAQDGLSLFARDYGPRVSSATPLVCLPGLTRNSADFHEMAVHFSRATKPARRVLALDYRGRGRSGYDTDWQKYDVRVEAGDVLAVLTAAGIEQAIFVGTSRGGVIAMVLGVMRPGAIKGVVLNDIGPVIDGQGLARIRQYVGKLPKPRDYEQAVDILKQYSSERFPAFSTQDWERMARRTWKQTAAGLVPDYDLQLMKGLAALDLEQPLPDFWAPFTGLTPFPMLSIRGANSDLFSADTQAEMKRRHPDCTVFVVDGQGHAPSLSDIPSLAAITRFVEKIV
jgi:pimeloyl-ACP methyl ester carboxylesterase